MDKQIFNMADIPLLMMTATIEYNGPDRQLIRAVPPGKGRSKIDPHEAFRGMLSPTWPKINDYLNSVRTINKTTEPASDERETSKVRAQRKLIVSHNRRIITNFDDKHYCYWKKKLVGPSNKQIDMLTFVSECRPDEVAFCQRYTVIRTLMNFGCIYLGERIQEDNWAPDGKWIMKMFAHDIGTIIHGVNRFQVGKHHLHVIESCRTLSGFPFKYLLPEEREY